MAGRYVFTSDALDTGSARAWLDLDGYTKFVPQPNPVAKSAAATLLIAELLSGMIVVTGTAAVALTLPTGTLCDAGIAPALAIDRGFFWSLVNGGTSLAATTFLAGTGHTIVGSAVVGIGASGLFLTRKTAANTFITYRMA